MAGGLQIQPSEKIRHFAFLQLSGHRLGRRLLRVLSRLGHEPKVRLVD